MNGGIPVAVEGGIIAVAPSQPVLADRHIREINMAKVVDIICNERILCGVHQMDMNVCAFFEVAYHVEVEIAYNVHACFSTICRIGCAAYQTDFFGTPVGKDEGAVKGVIA